MPIPSPRSETPVYAAMIRSLDEAVGRIVAALEEHRLADNTIIIFTSDNGGWHNVAREATDNAAYAGIPVTSNAPLRSGKASNYEGGTRVPLLVVWQAKPSPAAAAIRWFKARTSFRRCWKWLMFLRLTKLNLMA